MLNIIVQAGGRGSRLRYRCWNKPKCLVTINNKPLIYHLFDNYTDAHFHVIGDYKYDVLEKYLLVNKPTARVTTYKTTGAGTCTGISQVIENIPESEPIVVTWGDIVYDKPINFNNITDPIIYKTSCFDSRYQVIDEKIVKQKTEKDGIAGIFYFPNKTYIEKVDSSGSFLNWCMRNIKNYKIRECFDIREVGDTSTYETLLDNNQKCRFFNNIKINEKTVEKSCILEIYKPLIQREISWYKAIKKYKYKNIPKIISENPYIMQKIEGNHLFQINETNDKKQIILDNIFKKLFELHSIESKPADIEELKLVYVNKTVERIKKIYELIPFKNNKFITINGKKCTNIFYNGSFEEIEKIFDLLNTDTYHIIHGDPTLSNILIEKKQNPIFIDPRGYFYHEGIYGDKFYDYAKLYFSCVGNYDLYNRKKIILFIDEHTVEVLITDAGLANMATKLFNNYFSNEEMLKIKIIHALIWLGMSSYAIDDVDSILAAHFLGLYYLEEAIGTTNE
jgi:NDP-sugar pyrophosphorylase family protein